MIRSRAIRARVFFVSGRRFCGDEGGFSGAGGVMMFFCAMGRKKSGNFCRAPRAPVAVHGTGTVKLSNGVEQFLTLGLVITQISLTIFRYQQQREVCLPL
ncbi:MAG: hypothetical protein WBM28_15685 [Burkholderiales bacterium]